MFGNIGATELIIILVLALIIFGPGKLPEVGKAIGRSIREFREPKAGSMKMMNREAQSFRPRMAPSRVIALKSEVDEGKELELEQGGQPFPGPLGSLLAVLEQEAEGLVEHLARVPDPPHHLPRCAGRGSVAGWWLTPHLPRCLQNRSEDLFSLRRRKLS